MAAHGSVDRRDFVWAWFRHRQLNREEQATGGMPLDSPARREVMPILLGRSGTYMAMHADRPTLLRHLARTDLTSEQRMNVMWAASVDARELVTLARAEYERFLARGAIGQAIAPAVVAIRATVVAGQHDEADELLAQAVDLLPRVPEGSNPVFQLLACYSFAAAGRGRSLDSGAFNLEESDDPNVSWTNLAVRAAKAFALANEGEADRAIETLSEVVRLLDVAAPWAPNLPLAAELAVRVHFELERDDHLDALERIVRDKVLEPDIHYLETDPSATAAQVAALRGRHGEARAFFDAGASGHGGVAAKGGRPGRSPLS